MQNTLVDLLKRNPFRELGLSVSATATEIRRALQQAKLEVSMGIRQIRQEDLDFFEQSLLREPSCLEMRLLADWRDDRVLSTFNEPHQALMVRAQRVVDGEGTLDAVWEPVVSVAANWGLTLALQPFLPNGASLEDLWGDLLAELVREGTIRKGQPIPASAIPYAGTMPSINLAPVVALACSSLEADFEALARDIPANPSQGSPVGEVYKPWADNYEALVGRLKALARRTSDRPLEAARESAVDAAVTISTVFHNAGLFARAEVVLKSALALPLTEAAREHLNGDLRVVRLASCHRDYAEAMERNDSLGAQAALRGVALNTDDPEERTNADVALQRLQRSAPRQPSPPRPSPARRQSPPPPPGGGSSVARLRWGFGVLGVALVVLAALGLWGYYSSASSSADANDEPRVGDCVRDLASGLKVVDCAGRNDGLVVATPRLSGNSYPGRADVKEQAERKCPSSADAYFYPSRETWESGDRSVICVQE